MTNHLSLSVAAFVFASASLLLTGCAASNDDDNTPAPSEAAVTVNTDTAQPMRGRRESQDVCNQNWASCTSGCTRAYITPYGGHENTPDAYQAANSSCESACDGVFIACSWTANTTGL